MLRSYAIFWKRMILYAISGRPRFYLWIGFLLVLIIPGISAYYQQVTHGLIVTNLSDQVSWGAYIANFTFLVGVADAAVLMVVPAYIYNYKPTKDIVLLGMLMALAAVIMCLLFIIVDLGRPDHFTHILPFLGRLNFPQSVLAWDVIVLNGYLFLNFYITSYLLFMFYLKRKPSDLVYIPFVIISIFWAVSLHTVTAFLYSGLGGRPFWNTAILAPRFLISSFAGGPAILTLALRAIQKVTKLQIDEGVFTLMKKIVAVMMPVSMFLLFCEIFQEFYTDANHLASTRYLYFGLNGAHMLRPYIWGALIMNTIAMIVFVMPKLRDDNRIFSIACVFAILGIWTEKGMGLIVPGFIPSPLGDIVEYAPSWVEFFICLGIWALGALIYTLLAKVAIGVMTGELTEKSA